MINLHDSGSCQISSWNLGFPECNWAGSHATQHFWNINKGLKLSLQFATIKPLKKINTKKKILSRWQQILDLSQLKADNPMYLTSFTYDSHPPSFSCHSTYNTIHKKIMQNIHSWHKFANIFELLICKRKIHTAPKKVCSFHTSPGDLCCISQRFKPSVFPMYNLPPLPPPSSCPHLNAESPASLSLVYRLCDPKCHSLDYCTQPEHYLKLTCLQLVQHYLNGIIRHNPYTESA